MTSRWSCRGWSAFGDGVGRCVALAALVLGIACTSGARAAPITVGAVVSQSGDLALPARGLREALLLWQHQVNAAGGLLGRRVELLLLDDHSEAERDGRLYAQLIERDHAELLIGPFGSAATLMAAAAADQRGRVLVNATGIADQLRKVDYHYVFQVPAPLPSYATGALTIAKDAGYRRVFLVARDDPTARAIAGHARAAALALGLEPSQVELVKGGATDYSVAIRHARKLGAQAWIAFGQPADAAATVIALQRAGYAPKMFVAQGVANERFITLVGQAAEDAMGIAPYATTFPTRGNARFVRAYRKRWGRPPGLIAAEGFAAAEVLGDAVRRAGSLDQDALRAALLALHTETPLGPYAVDRKGWQVAAKPAVVQIREGRREIVWPRQWARVTWRLPYPPWSGRKLIGPGS